MSGGDHACSGENDGMQAGAAAGLACLIFEACSMLAWRLRNRPRDAGEVAGSHPALGEPAGLSRSCGTAKSLLSGTSMSHEGTQGRWGDAGYWGQGWTPVHSLSYALRWPCSSLFLILTECGGERTTEIRKQVSGS